MPFDRWTAHNFRVLMADPEGFAKVYGMALGSLGLHLGLTHFVDITHLPSGRKIAGFRTLGGAVAFVEELYYKFPWATERFQEANPRWSMAQASDVRDLIAKHREHEEIPVRESI